MNTPPPLSVAESNTAAPYRLLTRRARSPAAVSADSYPAEDEVLIHVTRRHWTDIVTEFLVLAVIWIVAGALL
ncbi:hypothetical protein [Streptomyces sp. NPDC048411]|uniref:hypothetical protein n=1 Tax=Streptomyces sp. NPDC048411 TaxID=3157206 RepID=UPI0034565FD8